MELHEYQKRCVEFIKGHPQCILSVGMGLGKTAACLHYIADTKPQSLLIVAPKRVAENGWQQEAVKWGLNDVADKMIIVKGTPRQRGLAILDVTHPYKIVSRDNLKDFYNKKFDVLIIDELTSFKNVKSQRTKNICSISAAVKVGLTGTFLANGAIDIYGQCLAVGLASCYQMNFFAWRATYFRDIMQGSGQPFQKWRLFRPLSEVLDKVSPYIFTLSSTDYLQIPDITHTMHPVSLSKTAYNQIMQLDTQLTCEIGNDTFTFDERQVFAKIQTLSNGFIYTTDEDGTTHSVRSESSDKLESVADFVESCVNENEHVLLFYAYVEERVWLTELLEKRGVKCDSVDNKDFLRKWNEGETQCLLAHPASAGHGLNMQFGGRVIVWSSLTFNYEFYAQANARLARQGQKNNVQIHYFIAQNTLEERVFRTLLNKEKEQNLFINLTKR